jgi:hypothetical protein
MSGNAAAGDAHAPRSSRRVPRSSRGRWCGPGITCSTRGTDFGLLSSTHLKYLSRPLSAFVAGPQQALLGLPQVAVGTVNQSKRMPFFTAASATAPVLVRQGAMAPS